MIDRVPKISNYNAIGPIQSSEYYRIPAATLHSENLMEA
jgi:hypothetical protein